MRNNSPCTVFTHLSFSSESDDPLEKVSSDLSALILAGDNLLGLGLVREVDMGMTGRLLRLGPGKSYKAIYHGN
jgi:hypothetical protein